MRPATLVVAASLMIATASCSGFDLSPSSVETWSGPRFPVERVTAIEVLPVADVRTMGRGNSVRTAQVVRETALSRLREKGYAVSASGGPLAAMASTAPASAVLDAGAVADRSPSANGFVLALAVEGTERDVVVAPATVRVGLRGVIVDVADRVVVWSGASVAEAGSLTGAMARSPGAALYSATAQAMRALLRDLPDRPD